MVKTKAVTLTADFETRSAVELSKAGAYEYARHPSTSIFCLGWKLGDGPELIWIPELEPMPEALWWALKNRRVVIAAQNAGFERMIFKYTLSRYPCLTLEQKVFLAGLTPDRFKCTAAKAAALALPRNLDDAAKVLKLAEFKDKVGNDLIKKYCKPRKPSKNNPSLWWTDIGDLRRIYKYCKTDCRVEHLLDEATPDLSPFEQKVWELDQTINERGIRIDVKAVRIILKMIAGEVDRANARIKKLTRGEVEKATQAAQIRKYLSSIGYSIPNLQAETIGRALKDRSLPLRVREILECRKTASKSSTSKYVAMLTRCGVSEYARECFMYWGASTGRWAGKSIQPQNFPRGIEGLDTDEAIDVILQNDVEALREKYAEKGSVMQVLSAVARGMLIPDEGYEFFCSDFTGVELRVLFWVAEHHAGLKAITSGKDLYCEMASFIYGRAITKGDKFERQLGKKAVLGCGFRMGWERFLASCHEDGMTNVTAEDAQKAVKGYRELHEPVKALWSMVEQAAIFAIKNPGKKVTVNKCTWFIKNDFLWCQLPSGRRLAYYKPRVVMIKKWGKMLPEIRHQAINRYMKKHKDPSKPQNWSEVSTHGGTLVENIVQAIARDFMAEAMIRVESKKYKIVLHAHDEILAQRKIGYGSCKQFDKLMAQMPEWGTGCPIAVEGWDKPRRRWRK